MVEEVVREMNQVQFTAALYGALAGGLVSLIVSTGLYLLNRFVLRRIGSIEFETPSDWNFAYLEWTKPELEIDEDGNQVIARYSCYRREPGHSYTAHDANYAVYDFTAEVRNTMDVASTLRNVQVAFMKDGQTIFVHYPFDRDNANDPLDSLIEKMKTAVHFFDAEAGYGQMPMPGGGLDHVRVIQVPSGDVTIRRLRGYISGADLNHLRGGCDEVRLRGTSEPSGLIGRKTFDEHIARMKTAPHQFPRGSDPRESVGMIGM